MEKLQVFTLQRKRRVSVRGKTLQALITWVDIDFLGAKYTRTLLWKLGLTDPGHISMASSMRRFKCWTLRDGESYKLWGECFAAGTSPPNFEIEQTLKMSNC
eukprot:5732963-Amphidinium_carterae.1